MSKSHHTPGPWTSRLPVGPSVSVAGVAWTICGPGDHEGGWLAVAEVLGTGPACEATPETNANARLIAAAPDLYAACQFVLDNAGGPPVDMLSRIRAAVLKATQGA